MRCVETRGDTHIPRGPVPALRKPEDQACINAAIGILNADIRTDHLAMRLGREHNISGLLPIPGWKFERAARKQTGPELDHSKRKSWSYYTKIVFNTEDDERGTPLPWERVERPKPPSKAELKRADWKAKLAAMEARRKDQSNGS